VIAHPSFELVVGRYLNLELLGRPHRIYVEEAGRGVPLVCLHTAGADSRQWRGLLNDLAVLDRFRVIAFDLPWHGKSSPPAGWQESDYRLEASDYLDIVLSVGNALLLDRPIVIGCSIGAWLVLNLALEQPEWAGAVVGIQAGAGANLSGDAEWPDRPDGDEGLIGPDAPDSERWETLWHCMQSGPGVVKGDLRVYDSAPDLGPRLGQIDTSRCPLWLLSGELDASCTPDDTLTVAGQIPGAVVSIMPGLGHFPMTEDYGRFRAHLLPVLDAALSERDGRKT
jgi:pimeloyl-ACP methyl ester carboxylesterase